MDRVIALSRGTCAACEVPTILTVDIGIGSHSVPHRRAIASNVSLVNRAFLQRFEATALEFSHFHLPFETPFRS